MDDRPLGSNAPAEKTRIVNAGGEGSTAIGGDVKGSTDCHQ